MVIEAFEKIEALLAEVNTAILEDETTLETFRIRFLGTKNIIKPLFGAIRTVPNERKKEYGQTVNTLSKLLRRNSIPLNLP